ncbi:luc7-like protein 3 [Centruroides sculpturatus]|uniref:luc7-like protein 3 n=1 Tax=Centruroides sculpturatus TaxID=218467 RepID=UPI000C6E888C|nr:luc7-like protein 3 [Centruroides sculpturatus]
MESRQDGGVSDAAVNDEELRLTVVTKGNTMTTTGNKRELVQRLEAALLIENARDNDVQGDDDADESEDEDSDIMRHTSEYSKPMFTFRDVDESLETFRGDDGKNVKWISNFEDMAEMCNWNGMQKIIYAKRLQRFSKNSKEEKEDSHKSSELNHWLQQRHASNVKQAEVAVVQEKQMEVCGAFFIRGDAQQRADDHSMEKQHVGYARLKSAGEEIVHKREREQEERKQKEEEKHRQNYHSRSDDRKRDMRQNRRSRSRKHGSRSRDRSYYNRRGYYKERKKNERKI